MEDLTFGEQVKIILGRKGMTIKRLAELIEEQTGKKMSRQNLTQRLGRDNFQEQDMRMIARILDCPFRLSIMTETQAPARSTAALEQEAIARTEAIEKAAERAAQNAEEKVEEPVMEPVEEPVTEPAEESVMETAAEPEVQPVTESADEEMPGADERDMTIGELYEIHQELSELEQNVKAGESVEEIRQELEQPKKERFHPGNIFLRRKNKEENIHVEETAAEETETARADRVVAAAQNERKYEDFEPVIRHNDAAEDRETGDVNPYTGREYQSNSVRMHPTRIGYVQVYDRTIHKWTDMTEWAFLGLQERKKALLGSAYEPPIYLD